MTEDASSLRLFIAVDLPTPMARSVSEVRRELESLDGPLRWVRPALMHLTLKFLGQVKSARVQAIDRSLETVRASAFKVSVSGVGFFPNVRAPRILWAGVVSEDLENLAGEIETRMVETGFPPERRKFTPHLTLARTRGSSPVRRDTVLAAERSRDRSFGEFTVDCFHLYESQLHPAGAIHTKIHEYLLESM